MSVPGRHDDEPVQAPTVVNVSCGLWGASAVLLIVGFVITLLSKEQIVADLVARAGMDQLPHEQVVEGTETLLWVLLVGAIAYAGLMGLFAYKAREGTRSARSVLAVLTVLLLVTQFVLFPNVVTVASGLLAVAALVLMCLPQVAHHYPRVPKSLP